MDKNHKFIKIKQYDTTIEVCKWCNIDKTTIIIQGINCVPIHLRKNKR